MRHYDEDELVLYHYGESRRRGRIDAHLALCGPCAARCRDIRETLTCVVDPAVPERDDRYGLEVWQRIRHDLPVQDSPLRAIWTRRALAAGVALLAAAAFAAGRYWPGVPPAPVTTAGGREPDAGTRVLLAAVVDHLDQSERVLLDVVNTGGGRVDVSDRQGWAARLVDANRLYRHAAERAGDAAVTDVLDELERNLLEIANGPSTLTPADLEAARLRLDAAALPFRVRALSDELREREAAPALARKPI